MGDHEPSASLEHSSRDSILESDLQKRRPPGTIMRSERGIR
jgi:hypothetical protein